MDGEKRVLCPFNSAHYILQHRLASHILQCKKNYPGTPLEACPYNSVHYIHKDHMAAHMEECENRSSVDRLRYRVQAENVKSIDHLIVREPQGVFTEDWDDDNESYLDHRDEKLKDKQLILMGETNVGAAQRRAFLSNEVARMADLKAKEKASGSSQVPRAGFGRGIAMQRRN